MSIDRVSGQPQSGPLARVSVKVPLTGEGSQLAVGNGLPVRCGKPQSIRGTSTALVSGRATQ